MPLAESVSSPLTAACLSLPQLCVRTRLSTARCASPCHCRSGCLSVRLQAALAALLCLLGPLWVSLRAPPWKEAVCCSSCCRHLLLYTRVLLVWRWGIGEGKLLSNDEISVFQQAHVSGAKCFLASYLSPPDNHLAEKARPEESGIAEISLHQVRSAPNKVSWSPLWRMLWNFS